MDNGLVPAGEQYESNGQQVVLILVVVDNGLVLSANIRINSETGMS